MAQIQLRPDLKTAGGEVSDIMLDGRYVGAITLVYREGDRISGSIQLDKELLTRKQRNKVIPFAQEYVQSMIMALGAEECEVVVSYNEYDHIITAADIQDVDAAYYQLVIVGEDHNQIEYHIYDGNHHWLAEAFMSILDTHVYGEVNWRYEPSDEEVEHMADLIVSDFDEDQIDTFTIDMKFKNEILETIELAHSDLLDDEDDEYDEDDEDDDEDDNAIGDDINDDDAMDDDEDDADEYEDDADEYQVDVDELEVDEGTIGEAVDDADEMAGMAGTAYSRLDKTGRSDYSIVLIRDDEDTLTYDIYKQSQGGIPIGTATVDLEKRQLTGFIEFRVPESENERQTIATLLMKELDKEKDYDRFNITMLYNNRPIEEIIFTTETIH